MVWHPFTQEQIPGRDICKLKFRRWRLQGRAVWEKWMLCEVVLVTGELEWEQNSKPIEPRASPQVAHTSEKCAGRKNRTDEDILFWDAVCFWLLSSLNTQVFFCGRAQPGSQLFGRLNTHSWVPTDRSTRSMYFHHWAICFCTLVWSLETTQPGLHSAAVTVRQTDV